MAAVNVLNVRYLSPNPCNATSPVEFEITMECISALDAKEVEWTMTYIGSAQDNKHDQLLDSVEVETIIATMKFVFEAPAPNLFLVPKEDQLDNSAVILSAKYRGREFCRVGYYLRHEYPVEFINSLRPPTDGLSAIVDPELPCGENLNLQVLQRLVDVENPRVTHYLIDWDAPNEQLVPPPAASEEIPDDDIINDDDEDEEDEDEDDDEEGGDVQMDMDEEIPEKTTGGIAETTNLSMTHE
jgi:histone chaperone ASF1